MSDQEQEQEKAPEGEKTFTQAEVEAMLEEKTGGLKAKVDELLGEKKTVSQKARELEEAQAKAEEDRLKEKQEFKELYEREQKSKAELEEKFGSFQTRIQKQEIELHTKDIGAELTKVSRDAGRAELLSEKAAQMAKYTDDGVKFEIGGIEVTKEQVLSHLSEKFPFLVDGDGSTGGGAKGASKSGGAESKNQSANDAKSKGDLSAYLKATIGSPK